MSNCLVLGANGFIGSHVVDSLANKNYFVRAFDKYIDGNTRFAKNENIEIRHGEFLNESDLESALDGIDYVFHFVSTTTPISSEANPLVEIDTNIRYSVELFQKCVDKNVKKLVYSSSGGSVYGNTSKELIGENEVPNPISPYAIGKLAVEKFLDYFYEKYGMESIVYRISNPYGTRQSLNARQGVIPIFLQQVIKDEPITIYGDGSMIRDFIYVTDVAKMIVGSYSQATQRLYNIGSGQGVSINELVEIIYSITGQSAKVNHVPAPATFVEKNVLDTSRFNSEFGLYPEVNLSDGIKMTWDHYLNSGS